MKFLALDFETLPGEFGPEPVEIGMVLFDLEGRIHATYEAAVPANPVYALHPRPLASLALAWPDIAPLLEDAVLVGHNLAFDAALLHRLFPSRLPPKRQLDTLAVARALLRPRPADFALTTLIPQLGLEGSLHSLRCNEHFQPHRALYDAFACALLLITLQHHPRFRQYLAKALPPELF